MTSKDEIKTDSEKLDAIYKWMLAQTPVVEQNIKTILSLEVYPKDIGVMTYVDAVKAVEKLGDGWRIPTLEELREIYKNKDASFCTSSSSVSGFPVWYWSSTEYRYDSSNVHNVRFSDGYEHWIHKDVHRLSCRPVRLVAAPAR